MLRPCQSLDRSSSCAVSLVAEFSVVPRDIGCKSFSMDSHRLLFASCCRQRKKGMAGGRRRVASVRQWARGRRGRRIHRRATHLASQHRLLAHVIHCIVATSMFAGKRVQKNVRVMVGVAVRCRARWKARREARAVMWCGLGGARRDLSCVAAKSVEVGRPD